MREMIHQELVNGATRDLDDWKAFCEKADQRLKVVGVKRPEGSDLSVLELRMTDELLN